MPVKDFLHAEGLPGGLLVFCLKDEGVSCYLLGENAAGDCGLAEGRTL